MGAFFSYLIYGDESVSDPLTGLTVKDKRLILSMRPALTKNPGETGAAVLYIFFEKYPKYQKYFPFKDVPLDQLKTNKKFMVHCNSVMYAIASWIDNVDKPDLLLGIFSKLGANHVRHNLPNQSFLDIGDVLVECLKPIMSEETHSAYKKLINLAVTTSISAAK